MNAPDTTLNIPANVRDDQAIIRPLLNDLIERWIAKFGARDLVRAEGETTIRGGITRLAYRLEVPKQRLTGWRTGSDGRDAPLWPIPVLLADLGLVAIWSGSDVVVRRPLRRRG